MSVNYHPPIALFATSFLKTLVPLLQQLGYTITFLEKENFDESVMLSVAAILISDDEVSFIETLCQKYPVLIKKTLLMTHTPCHYLYIKNSLSLPFQAQNLDEKIKRILGCEKNVLWQIGPFFFDVSKRTLVMQEHTIILTQREVELLNYLCENAESMVSKEEILLHVWSYQKGVNTRTLETHIYRLRQKMDELGQSGVLETDGSHYTLRLVQKI